MARKSESEEEDGIAEVERIVGGRVVGLSCFFEFHTSTIYLLYFCFRFGREG